MIDQLKIKLNELTNLINHISDSQGNDLKSLLDQSKMPPQGDGGDIGSGDVGVEDSDDDPKGMKVESVQVMGSPEEKLMKGMPEEKEMSDEELEEMLRGSL